MISFIPEIDKEYILKHVSEEEIYERYFNIEVSFRGKFCSPLRDDKNPTCNFFRHRRTKEIYLKDHAGHFCGNCFDALMIHYACTYGEVLEIIAKDFGLIDGKVNRKPAEREHRERTQSKIDFTARKWLKIDNEFWGKYGIDESLLKHYKVYPVQTLFLDDNLFYTFHASNPAYAYVFGDNQIKIYFPMKKDFRFICNTSTLQGYDQLPETGKLLIITKSMKDIMVLYNLGYNAIAPQSETQSISFEEWEEFNERFDEIYSFYDFDLTGVRTSNKMRKNYGIKPIFLTNGRFGTTNFGAKDASDKFEEILRRCKSLLEIKTKVGLSKVLLTGAAKGCSKQPLTGRKKPDSKLYFDWRNLGNGGFMEDLDGKAPF